MLLKTQKQPIKDSSGSILVSILMITLFLTVVISSILVLANSNLVRSRSRVHLLQAQYSAESGADSAIAALNAGNDAYTGSTSEVTVLTTPQYRSTYTVTVAPGATAKERKITATGKIYAPLTSATALYSRKIEVTAQRTSATTSSSMLSRNIINVESGVKNIIGKDIYANGYLQMNRNTTNLIAENITVAGKNTTAANCSIGGSGNMVKPNTFTTPGQTKTNVKLGFNNCINPPGNASNSNFEVTANAGSISKIGSTYIPFGQFMDNSYQNSPTGCSDWTNGSFPRSIPSTGNDKKTHYPNNGTNIDTSCGTNGSLNLTAGQYTIRNHAHIRANMCATSSCSPTFFNPDTGPAGIKYLFVEGSVNFDSVQTAPGSGSIVIVSYGADPASNLGACPLGGSIYLGNSGNSSARALYLLALNGVCLDKTRFGSDPALGGLSGKNLYIASNPGTPFDLRLDASFPTEQIPVDLAWRAIRYHRQ